VLSEVGPVAVTSANLTGHPPATTAEQAHEQLRGAVSLYLDDGPRQERGASTIVDCTGPEPVVLRHGSLSNEALREVLGDTVLHDAPPASAQPPASASAPIGGPRLVGSLRPSGVGAPRRALVTLGSTQPADDR
jgi:L-threonylcarbamoyladenylate synthase